MCFTKKDSTEKEVGTEREIQMYREEEIKELVALAGGVHETSVKTGLRIQTIYRLMNGQNRPSFETNMKLEALENELNKIKVS